MPTDDDRWGRFTIRAYRHPAAADARRVVFERADPGERAAAGPPAVVVLRAGGDLLIRYDPPAQAVPGLGKDDYLRKAAEVVRALPARS
jgi:hypothetical protein